MMASLQRRRETPDAGHLPRLHPEAIAAGIIGLAMTRVAIGGLTGLVIGLGVGLGARVSPIVAVCGAVVLAAVLAAIIFDQQRRP